MSADNINLGSEAQGPESQAPDTIPAPPSFDTEPPVSRATVSLLPQSAVVPESVKPGLGSLFASLLDNVFGTAWAVLGMTASEVAKLSSAKLQLTRLAIYAMFVWPMLFFGIGITIAHNADTLDGVALGRTFTVIGAFSLWLQAVLMVVRLGIYAAVVSGTTHLLGVTAKYGIDTSLPAVAKAARWMCGVLAWLTAACAYAMLFPLYRDLANLALAFTVTAALAFIGAAKWFESKVPRKVLIGALLTIFVVCTARFFSTNLSATMDEFAGRTIGDDKAWIVQKEITRLSNQVQAIQAEALIDNDGQYADAKKFATVQKYEARIAALKADPEKYFRTMTVATLGGTQAPKARVSQPAAAPVPAPAKVEAAPAAVEAPKTEAKSKAQAKVDALSWLDQFEGQ